MVLCMLISHGDVSLPVPGCPALCLVLHTSGKKSIRQLSVMKIGRGGVKRRRATVPPCLDTAPNRERRWAPMTARRRGVALVGDAWLVGQAGR